MVSLTHFCLSRFLTARKTNALEISIRLYDRSAQGAGGCAPLDIDYKTFEVDIALFNERTQTDNDEREQLIILSHELVHVKQWVTGEKFEYFDGQRCRFNGEEYSTKMEYWAQPWEHEAYGLERPLYELWMLEQK